ncbi:Organic radical activating enzyme [Malonomonas rubra DSM 5091]|uniref:7-carboxy-7-deazaguanine synthase n=1 Tax=Malonomonas rubra DSM 5091 TaxID=1122189 RepID=A0A1M6K8T7_MALRU|nr:7-carboxy-7-deazaguanine synthase QueE [Malonomonas rubra]SHJ55280.1 Organic radical activating enzyme [Malonomonas rubra DSM 5091]
MPAIPQIDLPLIEAFSSIQGEGLLVGCRQIFLRLPNCNLNCNYCDTPFASTKSCLLENPPGSGTIIELENPVSLPRLMETFSDWCAKAPGVHHSFSLTGGEPLLHADLLQECLPVLRKLLPIYLETNGTLPDQLETLISQIDWVSMDIKLESMSGEKTDWELQRCFLEIANRTQCYVKIVVGRETTDAELQKAAEIVSSVSENISLILQPVTIEAKPGMGTQHLLKMQDVVAAINPNVRIIPQTHVYLGLL